MPVSHHHALRHQPDKLIERRSPADGPDPLSILVAADSSLDKKLREQHLENLTAALPEMLSQPKINTKQSLAEALGPEAMDLVYCYCHSGYERFSQLTAAGRYLKFGEFLVNPLDVSNWLDTATWPDPHWPRRHPIVVLNGCHTTDTTSGSLSSFVPEFTNRAGASGVIGTEITLEQGLSGWAMELLLSQLAAGDTVGSALRQMRWTLLREGNLMGLAYTPYCLHNLRVREEIDRAKVS